MGVAVLLVVGVVAVAVQTITSHKTPPNIQGAWEGVVEMPMVGKFRVVLNVSGTNHSYHATVDRVDEREKGILIDKFVYNYPLVEFESKDAKSTYAGKLNSSADEMSGKWKQRKFTSPLVMKRTTAPSIVPDLLTENDYAPRAGSTLQGYWKGTLGGPVPHRVAFKIAEPTDGNFVAEMDFLDQGASNLVVSSVTYDKPEVQVDVALLGGIFKGKLSNDGVKIAGVWTAARLPRQLSLDRADPNATRVEQAKAAALEASKDYSYAGPNDLTGHWKGVLVVKTVKLHLALHIASLPNGDLFGSLDSIDQGANGVTADTVRFSAPNAHLEWKIIGGSYDGTIKSDKISGTWRRGGQALPLVFERSHPQ